MPLSPTTNNRPSAPTHLFRLDRGRVLSAEAEVRDGGVLHHDPEVPGPLLKGVPDVLGHGLKRPVTIRFDLIGGTKQAEQQQLETSGRAGFEVLGRGYKGERTLLERLTEAGGGMVSCETNACGHAQKRICGAEEGVKEAGFVVCEGHKDQPQIVKTLRTLLHNKHKL